MVLTVLFSMATDSSKEHVDRLNAKGIKAELRTIEQGDAIWLARSHSNQQEYVLDYIVERKSVEDLVASIKDGR